MVELLWFSTLWCGPCKNMERQGIPQALMDAGIKVTKIDVDEDPGTARQYGIMAVPSFVILKDGQSAMKLVGAREKGVLLGAIRQIQLS